MSKWATIQDALQRGENDARLLDGRDFNDAYWRNARRQLTNLQREYGRLLGERDALRACLPDAAPVETEE